MLDPLLEPTQVQWDQGFFLAEWVQNWSWCLGMKVLLGAVGSELVWVDQDSFWCSGTRDPPRVGQEPTSCAYRMQAFPVGTKGSVTPTGFCAHLTQTCRIAPLEHHVSSDSPSRSSQWSPPWSRPQRRPSRTPSVASLACACQRCQACTQAGVCGRVGGHKNYPLPLSVGTLTFWPKRTCLLHHFFTFILGVSLISLLYKVIGFFVTSTIKLCDIFLL